MEREILEPIRIHHAAHIQVARASRLRPARALCAREPRPGGLRLRRRRYGIGRRRRGWQDSSGESGGSGDSSDGGGGDGGAAL